MGSSASKGKASRGANAWGGSERGGGAPGSAWDPSQPLTVLESVEISPVVNLVGGVFGDGLLHAASSYGMTLRRGKQLVASKRGNEVKALFVTHGEHRRWTHDAVAHRLYAGSVGGSISVVAFTDAGEVVQVPHGEGVEPPAHEHGVSALALVPTGPADHARRYLVTGDTRGVLAVWDTAAGMARLALGVAPDAASLGAPVLDVCMRPLDPALAAAEGCDCWVFVALQGRDRVTALRLSVTSQACTLSPVERGSDDAHALAATAAHDTEVVAMVMVPSCDTLITADDSGLLRSTQFSTQYGVEAGSLRSVSLLLGLSVRCMAARGTLVVVGTHEGSVVLMHAPRCVPFRVLCSGQPVVSLAFMGPHVWSGHTDGSLRQWALAGKWQASIVTLLCVHKFGHHAAFSAIPRPLIQDICGMAFPEGLSA